MFQILFEVSNNEAEYEALLQGISLAISLGIKRLLVYSDSLLVVQQVNKEWDVNKDTMDAYVEFTAWALLPYFQYYSVYWFMTGTTSSLLHGPCSHTFCTTPSIGSRLVLCRVYYVSLAPIHPLLLRLLVHDWYYIEFTAWVLLPYTQYYSIYWFMTGTTSSLLHGPCSHSSSDTQITSF
jgi:hypothetical protein